MLVWNGLITTDSLPPTAFRVGLRDENENAYTVEVVETAIAVNYIFLKLREEIPPGSTPFVRTSTEYEIEFFLWGRFYTWEIPGVQVDDGIPPTLTMSLSGGSGTGFGDEGPDRLTKDKIDITVSSDEPLAEPPNVTVVCNDIQWSETDDSALIRNNIDDFIASRSGQLTDSQASAPDSSNGRPPDYWCGDDQDIVPTTHSMTATGATSWTYEWRNPTEAPNKLNDGLLTAVTYARDQSEYQHHYTDQTIHNWSAATADFTLDTVLKSPLEPGGGYVFPANGFDTHDLDPSLPIYFQFEEPTTVVVDSIDFDGSDAIEHFEPDTGAIHDNAWFWWGRDGRWTEPLEPGRHVLTVDASDAAGNSKVFTLTYEVHDSHLATLRRDPFILNLYPGWNAISFPAMPRSHDINNVFNHPALQSVFVPFGSNPPIWSAATRRDGEWHPLNPSQYVVEGLPRIPHPQNMGVWVYSSDFVQLPVRLLWPTGVSTRGYSIPRVSGWNFVGITAYHRHHQSEVAFGSALKNPSDQPITAATYFNHHVQATGDFKIAFRWNAQTQSFERLQPDDYVQIGQAIWVYYPESGVLDP